MERRTFLKGIAGAAGVAGVSALAACTDSASSARSATSTSSTTGTATTTAAASLVFDTSGYTTKSKTVSTAGGSKKVTYRHWQSITYVAEPVDTKYQSLDVSVPVTIDGASVDAGNAPILLSLNIGGYMSSSVSTSGSAPSATTGSPPNGSNGGVTSGSGATAGSAGQLVSNGDLALAAGYVVVEPGVRGRDNVKNGRYYGKAPAAIVDLKAAVRFIRANAGRIPGNTEHIVSSGSSAGGALSALLAASGDSSLYDAYVHELGAADASDAIFASADYCPITDLEHADMAYEWMFGDQKYSGSTVDQTVSKQLANEFVGYQKSLGLRSAGVGAVTAATYPTYLLTTFLQPAAAKYLSALTSAKRTSYLAANSWISYSAGRASFSWADFVDHVGRSKSAPAFDGFTLGNAENIEFGDTTTNARHFTLYSLRHATGSSSAQLAKDLPKKINMMNPMYFVGRKNPHRAKHWWIRVGTSDTDTSLTVVGNLAAGLRNLGDEVNAAMYWDAGHGANDDPEEFISWVGRITGYAKA